MNLEKNAPYLAMALIAITLIFSQIGIFDEKYNLDLNLLIQESENDAFIELNEYSLSKNPRLQLSVINSSTDELAFYSSGTSGHQSKIYTDRLTRIDQQRSLYNLISNLLQL